MSLSVVVLPVDSCVCPSTWTHVRFFPPFFHFSLSRLCHSLFPIMPFLSSTLAGSWSTRSAYLCDALGFPSLPSFKHRCFPGTPASPVLTPAFSSIPSCPCSHLITLPLLFDAFFFFFCLFLPTLGVATCLLRRNP